MDVQMPVMGGREAARAIRASKLPHVREIPIAAMTADAFTEDIQSCRQAGMDAHIAKPIRMEMVCKVIRELWKPR